MTTSYSLMMFYNFSSLIDGHSVYFQCFVVMNTAAIKDHCSHDFVSRDFYLCGIDSQEWVCRAEEDIFVKL